MLTFKQYMEDADKNVSEVLNTTLAVDKNYHGDHPLARPHEYPSFQDQPRDHKFGMHKQKVPPANPTNNDLEKELGDSATFGKGDKRAERSLPQSISGKKWADFLKDRKNT